MDHGHDHHNHSIVQDSCCSNKDCCSSNSLVIDHGHDPHHNHSIVQDCCSNKDCCSSKIIDHGHDHHNHSIVQEDCCSNKDCCSSNSLVVDHGHNHHGHSERDDCCSNKDCCSSNNTIKNINNPTYENGNTIESHEITVESIESHEITVSSRNCSECDPKSSIPHAVQVSRIRVANLCCAGEERIILKSLTNVHGIQNVSVNVIGRYAIVKHCPVHTCCASVDKIITILNDQRLGASIFEINNEDESNTETPFDISKGFQALFVWACFAIGLALEKNLHLFIPSVTIFAVGTAVGIIPILQGAYLSAIRQNLDINILILIALIAAFVIAEYSDPPLMIALYLSADLLERTIMTWIRNNVKINPVGLPKKAILKNGKSIPIEELKLKDIICVRAGEMIPADGLVIYGECSVDESSLTGEAAAVKKNKGSRAYSGSILQNGYIEISIDTEFQNSSINKLTQAISDVQAEKGFYGSMVDLFASYWTPTILIVAFFLVIIGGGVSGNWHYYTLQAVTLLVLACPCAMIVAAPIPSVTAIACAGRNGVLIKGSSIIEKISSITDIASDKTGTLTEGTFKVRDRIYLTEVIQDGYYNPLELAAAVEDKSSHPLASAIISEFCPCIAEMEGDFPLVKNMKVKDGIGIEGWVQVDDDWKHVLVGNEKILKDNCGKVIISNSDKEKIREFSDKNSTATIVMVAVDDQLDLIMALNDKVKVESKSMISQLMQMNMVTTMLTGDHKNAAIAVCRQINIPDDRCFSRLQPMDKLEWVKTKQQNKNHKVLMIGDGINDAAALALAEVGAAMGDGGTAMASYAANVVILSDNLLKIPGTITLSKLAKACILQNVTITITIKLIAVIFALVGSLKFWMAMVVDAGCLIIVLLNGIRPMFSNAYNDSEASLSLSIEKNNNNNGNGNSDINNNNNDDDDDNIDKGQIEIV